MVRNFLVDLDGTIYRGEALIPYAKEFVDFLNAKHFGYLFVTNCPQKKPKRIVEKLTVLGLDVPLDCVVSSGMASIQYILERHRDKKVYVIGSEDFLSMCKEQGISLVDGNAEVVLVGYDPEFDYKKMKVATQSILEGATFLATNGDVTIPDGDRFVPHTGAIVASIAAATGKSPKYIGKPASYFLEYTLKILNCDRTDLAIIGDRIDTDMQFALTNGILGYLVLTGVTSKHESASLEPMDHISVVDNLYSIIECQTGEYTYVNQPL